MKVKLSYRSLTTQATVIVKTKSAYSEHHLFQLLTNISSANCSELPCGIVCSLYAFQLVEWVCIWFLAMWNVYQSLYVLSSDWMIQLCLQFWCIAWLNLFLYSDVSVCFFCCECRWHKALVFSKVGWPVHVEYAVQCYHKTIGSLLYLFLMWMCCTQNVCCWFLYSDVSVSVT